MRLPRWLRRLFDTRGEKPDLWRAERPRKPRVRLRPDGWITHPRGQPFPFDPLTIVEVQFSSGAQMLGRDADYARVWHENMWLGRSISRKFNIVAYRIVSFAKEGATT